MEIMNHYGASWTTQTPNQYCNNCVATDSVMVNIIPSPTFALSSDTISQVQRDSAVRRRTDLLCTWSNSPTKTYAASNEFIQYGNRRQRMFA